MDEERFDFENLKVYQKALGYVDFVYEITKNFPKAELYKRMCLDHGNCLQTKIHQREIPTAITRLLFGTI